MRKILFISLSLLSLFSFILSENGDFGAVPMISVTWDNNIGFNYGVGLALGKWGEGIFAGVYTSYSYSKKGNNLSLGSYTGVGVATFRIGVNRLKLKEDNQEYWGIETTPSMFLGHLRLGILKDNDRPKLSYALGLGIF